MSVPQPTGAGATREENPMEALVSAREQLRQAHNLVDQINERLYGADGATPELSPSGPQNLGSLAGEVRTSSSALVSRMNDTWVRMGEPIPEPTHAG